MNRKGLDVYTVITLFYSASTTTRGNWFQTNPPEHESNDRAGDTVTSVLPMKKKKKKKKQPGTSAQIWSSFVTVLWSCGAVKPILQTGPGYWFLCQSCEVWFPKSTVNCGCFSENSLESSYNFNPIKITCTEKNGSFSLFETNVNDNLTFAYIMTFHCTSV